MATATTPPEAVRGELEAVTADAGVLLAAAAAERASVGPEAIRGALFEAAQAIAEEHKQAAAELAAAWYDELREAADLATTFSATPVAPIDLDALTTTVAVATQSLFDLIQADIDRQAAAYEAELTAAIDTSVNALSSQLQKEIAAGFRDTIEDNATRDPDAVGWRRHTRPGACRFCRFLADKGAIYSKSTARFAAHTDCHCLASPAFDGDDGPKASVMQYVASQRKRTKAEKKRLRELLDDRYGPEEPKKAAKAPVPPPDAAGGAGKPPADPPPTLGLPDDFDPPDREAIFGTPPAKTDPEWDAYWDRRRAALPASYNPADMLPPFEIEFAERMHDLGEDITWISQENTEARIDPVTKLFRPVHDFAWARHGSEWEHKGLEPTTPVDAVHIERQISKSTRKNKPRVVVDVGNRPLPPGTLEELARYNLRPERPSATEVWVMSQGQLYKVELLPGPPKT